MRTQRRDKMAVLGVAAAVGLWAIIGLVVALLGVLAQPQYLRWCDVVTGAGDNIHLTCAPVSKATMAGYSLVFFGILAAIVAPIVLALRSEAKSTQRPSEGSWRAENYGLLAGVLYMAAGILLLVLTD